MSVGAMQSVTVGVSDLAASLRLFRDVMELKVVSDIEPGSDLLAAWGVERPRAARLVELACGDYPIGRLRLLWLDPVPTRHVRLDPAVGGHDTATAIGPKAIDFYVRSPIADYVDELVAAGCVARSRPVHHVLGDSEQEEIVLFGPDGVPLLLMVGHRHPASSLRAGSPHGRYSEVPTISVIGDDPERTRRFYDGALGLTATVDNETEPQWREQVCKLVGVPAGTQIWWLMYQRPEEPSGKILIVHFVGAGGARLTGRMQPGNLGVVLYTHESADLDALAVRVRAGGGTVVHEPARIASLGRRMMLVRGPNEELFEFVER